MVLGTIKCEFESHSSDRLLWRITPNGKGAVLKTAGLRPLGVRVSHPPRISPIDAIGSISSCHGESRQFESDIGL